jgi:hypothetical protein
MKKLIMKGVTSFLIPIFSFIISLIVWAGQGMGWEMNLFFSAGIFIVSGVLLEVFFIFYYSFKEGNYVSVISLLNREQTAYARELTDGKKKNIPWIDVHFPHPYLSFVHSQKLSLIHETFDGPNNAGFCGPDFPDEKIEDRYVILLTGGSVASSFGQMFKGGPRFLEEALNKNYISPNGKKFLVLNGAMGGWKQPQQAIMFLFYAHVADALVTLDGFNESSHFDHLEWRFELPMLEFWRVNPLIEHGNERLMASWLNGNIYNFSRKNWLLSHSHYGYFMAKSLRDAIRLLMKQVTQDKGQDFSRSLFKLPNSWSREKCIEIFLERYKDYFRYMNAIAEKMDIKTAYFIQPAPAISKPLTPDEIEMVGDLGYKERYLKLANEMLTLRNEGIPMHSLLDILGNVTETIYRDPIHFWENVETGESPGNEIMAEEMTKILAETFGLQKKEGTLAQA